MHLYLDDNQANKEYGFRDGFVSNPLSIAARSGYEQNASLLL